MSKKANKVKRAALAAERAALELEQAEAAAAAALAAAKAAEPPKPPGKKATLIAAKKAGAKKSSRLSVTRGRAEPASEVGNTPTAWAGPPAAQTATRAFAGRLMTGQIAPKFKPTIGAGDANTLAVK